MTRTQTCIFWMAGGAVIYAATLLLGHLGWY